MRDQMRIRTDLASLGPRFARTSLRSAAAKLETAVYPFKLARHASKPRQTPFQTIPVISFFDRRFFFPDLFSAGNKFGRVFCQDLEGLTFFGRLQQIAEGFLLQIQLLSGLYGSWSRKYHLTPHHLPPTPTPHRPTNPPTPPRPKNKPTTFRRILTNVPRCVSNSFQSVYFSGRL